MSASKKTENLIRTKTALAEKYESLARLAGSQAKRNKFTYMSKGYRREAERLSGR